MFIPQKIKIARREVGLTQGQLIELLFDEKINISRQTLVSWEHGTTLPRAHELAALCMAVNKPVGYFFDLKHFISGKVEKGK